jgi:hypothetical protein
MDIYWLRALDEAEQAELRARALRDRFGLDAETRCREELATFSAADPRRRNVEDVARALRWT